MPTLVIFVALAILLAIVLAMIVLVPWFGTNKDHQNNQLIALNVAVFKARIEELHTDFEQNKIDEYAFKTQKTELERQLLLASEDNTGAATMQSDKPTDGINESSASQVPAQSEAQTLEQKYTRSLKARLTLLICIPLLMVLGYFLSADRTSVIKLWQAQDELGQVADDLITAKIDTPPDWATQDLVSLMTVLQANVHHHASDAARWLRLSDIFLAFEANDLALETLNRAYRLNADDEDIAVRYAQTRFYTSGGMLDLKSRHALESVLRKNPEHQRAQLLMAVGEVRAGNFDAAQSWIDKLRLEIASKEGDHSAALASLDELSQKIIVEQKNSMNANADEAQAGVGSNAMGQMTAASVELTVNLNTSLLPLVESSDVLFVIVKEATGGAPLAVKPLPATQLIESINKGQQGIIIELSDEDAMMPTHTISQAIAASKALVATARISKTGQANAASGDLSAADIPLTVDDTLATTNNTNSADNSHTTKQIKATLEINEQLP